MLAWESSLYSQSAELSQTTLLTSYSNGPNATIWTAATNASQVMENLWDPKLLHLGGPQFVLFTNDEQVATTTIRFSSDLGRTWSLPTLLPVQPPFANGGYWASQADFDGTALVVEANSVAIDSDPSNGHRVHVRGPNHLNSVPLVISPHLNSTHSWPGRSTPDTPFLTMVQFSGDQSASRPWSPDRTRVLV